jgi:hypothetical protein
VFSWHIIVTRRVRPETRAAIAAESGRLPTRQLSPTQLCSSRGLDARHEVHERAVDYLERLCCCSGGSRYTERSLRRLFSSKKACFSNVFVAEHSAAECDVRSTAQGARNAASGLPRKNAATPAPPETRASMSSGRPGRAISSVATASKFARSGRLGRVMTSLAVKWNVVTADEPGHCDRKRRIGDEA